MRCLFNLFAALLLTACTSAMEERAHININTPFGRVVRLHVEVARTTEQIQRGLMMRNHLGVNEGMIFLFDTPASWSFWMKDTLIPLDIIFIAEGGRVLKVKTNAQPLDETPIPSGGPVIAVLEIPSGRASSLGIRKGSVIDITGF